jgi:hypothetical protein
MCVAPARFLPAVPRRTEGYGAQGKRSLDEKHAGQRTPHAYLHPAGDVQIIIYGLMTKGPHISIRRKAKPSPTDARSDVRLRISDNRP